MSSGTKSGSAFITKFPYPSIFFRSRFLKEYLEQNIFLENLGQDTLVLLGSDFFWRSDESCSSYRVSSIAKKTQCYTKIMILFGLIWLVWSVQNIVLDHQGPNRDSRSPRKAVELMILKISTRSVQKQINPINTTQINGITSSAGVQCSAFIFR